MHRAHVVLICRAAQPGLHVDSGDGGGGGEPGVEGAAVGGVVGAEVDGAFDSVYLSTVGVLPD